MAAVESGSVGIQLFPLIERGNCVAGSGRVALREGVESIAIAACMVDIEQHDPVVGMIGSRRLKVVLKDESGTFTAPVGQGIECQPSRLPVLRSRQKRFAPV